MSVTSAIEEIHREAEDSQQEDDAQARLQQPHHPVKSDLIKRDASGAIEKGKQYIINRKEFLGKGTSSRVFKGLDSETGVPVAIKVIDVSLSYS